jgi:hypothetical protein
MFDEEEEPADQDNVTTIPMVLTITASAEVVHASPETDDEGDSQ